MAFNINQQFPPLRGFTDWSVIPEALKERGYTDSEVRAICGENFGTVN